MSGSVNIHSPLRVSPLFLTPKSYMFGWNHHMPFKNVHVLAVIFLNESPSMSLPVYSAQEHWPGATENTSLRQQCDVKTNHCDTNTYECI